MRTDKFLLEGFACAKYLRRSIRCAQRQLHRCELNKLHTSLPNNPHRLFSSAAAISQLSQAVPIPRPAVHGILRCGAGAPESCCDQQQVGALYLICSFHIVCRQEASVTLECFQDAEEVASARVFDAEPLHRCQGAAGALPLASFGISVLQGPACLYMTEEKIAAGEQPCSTPLGIQYIIHAKSSAGRMTCQK